MASHSQNVLPLPPNLSDVDKKLLRNYEESKDKEQFLKNATFAQKAKIYQFLADIEEQTKGKVNPGLFKEICKLPLEILEPALPALTILNEHKVNKNDFDATVALYNELLNILSLPGIGGLGPTITKEGRCVVMNSLVQNAREPGEVIYFLNRKDVQELMIKVTRSLGLSYYELGIFLEFPLFRLFHEEPNLENLKRWGLVDKWQNLNRYPSSDIHRFPCIEVRWVRRQ